MTTIDLNAAAAFLGIHRETLRERAAAGIIPGAKIGKEWRFLPDDLTAYFRSQCRSSVAPAARTGGSTSATLAAEELDALLADVLQKLGGWATRDMLDVYARLAPSYVSQFAGNARPVGAVKRKKVA